MVYGTSVTKIYQLYQSGCLPDAPFKVPLMGNTRVICRTVYYLHGKQKKKLKPSPVYTCNEHIYYCGCEHSSTKKWPMLKLESAGCFVLTHGVWMSSENMSSIQECDMCAALLPKFSRTGPC